MLEIEVVYALLVLILLQTSLQRDYDRELHEDYDVIHYLSSACDRATNRPSSPDLPRNLGLQGLMESTSLNYSRP